MKWKLLFILLFTAFFGQAQTKVIGHKSHSGSHKSFAKVYKNNLFDVNRSNFGLPGNRNIIILDKVIAVNDSVIALKLRESIVCFPFDTRYKDLKKSDFKTKTDTLKNHKIFNKKNTIAFIKSSRNFYPVRFNNPIDSVVFVGFRKK